MTVIYCDSFDNYGSADMTERGWVGNVSYSIVSAGNGRRGTAGLMVDQAIQGGVRYIRRQFSADSTVTIGWAMRVNLLSSTIAVAEMPYLLSSAGGGQICVQCDTGGNITVRRPYNGTILGTIPDPIGHDEWNHYQLQVYVHDTNGTAELKLNGTTVIDYGPGDTLNSGSDIGMIRLGVNSSNGYNFYIDDLYILDSASPNNDFLGDCRVDALFPDGAGTSTDWTPSAGSNYDCVNEADPNDDTDYITENTIGDHDSYTFDDLSTASGSVFAVQSQLYAKKDDAGSRDLKTVIRSGTTDYTPGSTHSMGDSYHAYLDQYQVDPDTSSAWTISGVNAAEFGVKLEA